MIAKPVLDAIRAMIASFEQLGVEYVIGGSVASTFYGMDRTTVDVDIAVDLRIEQVAPLVKQLEGEYYIDAEMLEDAIRHRSSCNLIYLPNWIKIDLFISKGQSFDKVEFQRATRDSFSLENGTMLLNIVSPEDIVLRKLLWYKDGGAVSERQWLDVLGVLKVQAARLDREYMAEWAANLSISDLLKRAMEDAGLPPLGEDER